MTVRKILTAALAIMMMFSTFSCGGKDNGLPDDTTTAPATTQPQGNDGYTIVSWMNSSYYKNLQSYEGPEEKKTEFDLYMAKNETEATQIAIRSSVSIDGVSFSFDGGLPEGIKGEFFEIKTVLIEKERWPDGLIPLENGRAVDIKKNKTLSVLVRFTSEADTPAAKSSVKVLAKDGEGNVIGEYKINITVWNITIPEETAITTYMPVCRKSLAKQYGLGDIVHETLDEEKQAELDRLYKQYYDFLLEYGISGGVLPYDILDPRADEYLNDPRVSSFIVAEGEFDATKVKAIYDKIKGNPTWLKKAVYYVLDEPTTSAMLDTIKSRSEAFRKIAPKVKIASAYYMNVNHSSGDDITEFLQKYIDVPTPKLCLFDRLDGGMQGYKARFEEFLKEDENNEVWTYVCWEPAKPYVNIFVNEQGIDHRIMFIQTYDINASGWLYWRANIWYDIENNISPWNNMATIPWMTYDVYGDGCVMYPGNDVDVDGPCSSLRLESIRDGLEDIALLKMAEEHLGKEATDDLVNLVTRNITRYTEDEAVFDDFRMQLGNAVEAALKNK